MKFNVQNSDKGSSARAGRLVTGHGSIETPVFMPVGTVASVKAVTQEHLMADIDARIILGNTYHLYLRPGLDVLREAGGLHRFMGWDRPLLTDSGGYQVFSLAHRRKLTEEGARFQSHIDGSHHLFTPENVMEIQRVIGADIIMAFDECNPYPCAYNYAQSSMELTHRWLDRCIAHFNNGAPLYGYKQALFPIVQGSVYKDLREQSATYISSKDCLGNAIGGLSVGEPHEEMYAMTELVCSILPADRPRYLMGVGTPANLLECIALGVDMLDCVMPTRNARNGQLFTTAGIINIRNKKWEKDFSPVDPDGTCLSNNYSKAYLRHLFMANELLGLTLATLHNLSFYLWLVRSAREQIMNNSFRPWKDKMVPQLENRL